MGINFSYTYRFKGEVDLPDNAYKGPAAIFYQGSENIGYQPRVEAKTQFIFSDIESNKYRDFNLIPSASLAVSYRLTDKISIGLEPTFRFSLKSQVLEKYETFTYTYAPFTIDSTHDTSHIFWNYGINTSIYYNF